MNNVPMKVVFYWHMHQPEYRDMSTGEYVLPWTYLHVIKDYVDMVAHLEDNPNARAVINFAPVLLEQIEDYAKQIKDFLNHSAPIRDPLLSALASTEIPVTDEDRLTLVQSCLRTNRHRTIERYQPYQKIVAMADWLVEHPQFLSYADPQFFADLLVWYHLAWMGETVKFSDLRIKRLLHRESVYVPEERLELFSVIGELLDNVLDRYKTLAKNGQIELSMTPYAHPIMPLLLDINSAKEAMPDAPMPEFTHYPGGEERVRWHIEKGFETFQRIFGCRPIGCWPSEGAICDQTLKILDQSGFRWTASGQNVLHNSLSAADIHIEQKHRPYQLDDTQIQCFFRDDGLSDLIGFKYSTWHGDDAVNDLVKHLETIAEHQHHQGVISIIMDGENAWEHYPQNGFHFLNGLYKTLSEHSTLRLSTFSECLNQPDTIKAIPHVVTGSWVYGTLSTWIGDTDKNRAWDMLNDAKDCFDRVIASGVLSNTQQQQATLELAICEGSDWFWWFGEYNSAESVSDFERLYRANLQNLYRLLDLEPPSYLFESFTFGGGDPEHGGAMRTGSEH